MRVFDALRQIRDRHVLERSTQVGFTRFAHVQAPISGKPEIGVCSTSPLRGPFAVSVLNRRGGAFRPKSWAGFCRQPLPPFLFAASTASFWWTIFAVNALRSASDIIEMLSEARHDCGV